jgi:hypothetical protein
VLENGHIDPTVDENYSRLMQKTPEESILICQSEEPGNMLFA